MAAKVPPQLGNYLAYAFGTFCILSAGPFVGIPRNTRAAEYYTGPDGKNAWLSRLTGGRLSTTQAGYFGAASRIVIGAGLISQRFRKPTCGFLAVGIGVLGTYLAWRDGRPLLPQFGMIAGIVAVGILG